MTTRTGRNRLTPVAAAAIVAGALVVPLRSSGPPARKGGGDTFVDPMVASVDLDRVTAVTAEVSIVRTRTDGRGNRKGAAPSSVSYRLERRHTAGGWRSTWRLVRRSAPVIRGAQGDVSLDVPPAIGWVEDAGDGTPARVFNERGVEVRLPSHRQLRALADGVPGALKRLGLPEAPGPDAARDGAPALSGAQGLAGLAYAAGGRETRQAAIARALGRVAERRGGLDRYVSLSGGDRRDTVIDAATALPVEVTLSRDGVPIERVRHAWSRAAGGTTVRRGVRSEHRLPGTDGEWMHVDVEFGGLRMAVGGVR